MVLIGVGADDTKEIADKLVRKLVNMRIFEDADGRTNLGLKDVEGELLLISQFYALCGLQEGQSAVVYQGGCAGDGRAAG